MSSASTIAYRHESERVAHRLGLPVHGPGADEAIVDYCRETVKELTGKLGLPETMDELLSHVATCLSVDFFEVRTDEDLERLRAKYPPRDEPAIIAVLRELDGDLDAITIRRTSPQQWDRRYLAVINCRDKHYHRRYFSKWHELTHLLIEGEQLALAFRQTPIDRPDPGEVLVDKIAAELAFLPEIVGPHAKQCIRRHGITLDAVDALCRAVAPEASRRAASVALIRHTDRPAWYLRCKMSLKPSEKKKLSDPNASADAPEPKLRVMEAPDNPAARGSGIRLHPWMRAPEAGIIARSLESARGVSGTEPLSAWVTDEGRWDDDELLLIDCVATGDQVVALVSLEDG